jgi:hypothetical protein
MHFQKNIILLVNLKSEFYVFLNRNFKKSSFQIIYIRRFCLKSYLVSTKSQSQTPHNIITVFAWLTTSHWSSY